MTDAPTAITHSRILKIALPIVLSNATVPILGAVDTGVVGQMGLAAPIGAVGIGAVILSTLYWVFGFLRMGTTGLVSQARGAGDNLETGALFMRGLILAAIGGLIFIVGQSVIFAGAFWMAPASDEVETLASQYLRIRVWGAPATIALYVITGWLIAVERTRGILVLQLWMNGLNIALDLWFVLGLGWGVQGVAIATLIAELSGLALGLWLCRENFKGKEWYNWARIFDPVRLRRMLAVNGDIMLRSVIITVSFTTFLFMAADFGDVTLAANHILLQFLEITAFALDGFAFSAEALVGNAVGRKARGLVRKSAVMSSIWGIGAGVFLGLFFYIAGPWLIDVMSTAEDVRIEGRVFLIWILLAPIIGGPAWMLDGIFFGATWTKEMRNATIQSVVIYIIALMTLIPMFGNHGLWASLMVLNLARGITLLLRYPRLEAQI